MKKHYRYRGFGLDFETCLPFPELLPMETQAEGEPDVRIRFAQVPDHLEDCLDQGVCFQAKQNRFLFSGPGALRVLVMDGREILISDEPGICSDDIRVFVLGSCMGALLLQRGLLPLHASAIEVNGTAVAFTGPSGAGKSTLAAAFHKRGYPVLGDDLLALKPGPDGTVEVFPGLRYFKLWKDMVEKYFSETFPRNTIRKNINKYHVPCDHVFSGQSLPLSCVYILQAHTFSNSGDLSLLIESVQAHEKINFIIKNTYRLRYVDGLGVKARHFMDCGKTCRSAQVRKLPPVQAACHPSDVVDLLEKDFNR